MRTVVIRMEMPERGGSGYPVRILEWGAEGAVPFAALSPGEIPFNLGYPDGHDGSDPAERIFRVLDTDDGRRNDSAEIGRYLRSLLNESLNGWRWFEWCADCPDTNGEPHLRVYLDHGPGVFRACPGLVRGCRGG